MSTSACVSPVSGFTWSAASVSGTDAEAMSGAFPVAGFEGGISTIEFLCDRLHCDDPLPTDHSQKGMPTLAKRHFQLRISGMPL